MRNAKPFDNTLAFGEGWGLWDVSGEEDGIVAIQRLDDPRSVNPAWSDEPIIESDHEAFMHVVLWASAGSEYHARALYLHEGGRP